MPICPSCGTTNRADARFCLHCAARLPQAPELPARPSPDDHAWLAATLTHKPAYSHEKTATAPRAAANSRKPHDTQHEGARMDATQPPTLGQPDGLFAGRYEIVAQQGDQVEAIDRQPWKRCWACGATSNDPGELFCTECGANLDNRHYQGQLSTGAPSGLALVTSVTDAATREVLPPVWDQVHASAAPSAPTLTLVSDSGRAPVNTPLDELQALYIG
ncbi:hypothetical protein SE17_30085, partial [Kouleothrix aurantiaca]